MNKNRISAFTIIEVTITMLVAALLIGLTYTTYSIVSKSYLSFNTKNNEMADLERLDKLLKKDFTNSELIEKDSSGVSFKGADRIIKYEFNPDFIVRVSSIVDTFKMKTDGLHISFEGQPLNELSSSEEQNRIDELEINILYQNEKIPYHYHKQYSSSDLIQRNPDALN